MKELWFLVEDGKVAGINPGAWLVAIHIILFFWLTYVFYRVEEEPEEGTFALAAVIVLILTAFSFAGVYLFITFFPVRIITLGAVILILLNVLANAMRRRSRDKLQ